MARDIHSGVASYARTACTNVRGPRSFAHDAQSQTAPSISRRTVATHGRPSSHFSLTPPDSAPGPLTSRVRHDLQVVFHRLGLVIALQEQHPRIVVRPVQQG